MAWNEPGEGGNDRQAPNNKERNPWQKRNEPPDLEELLKKFWGKIQSSLRGTGGSKQSPPLNAHWIKMILGVILAFYVLSGIYIVQPAEKVVVTRFGKYCRVENSGPHWLIPGIESKSVVNVERIDSTNHSGDMLTQDENIVFVEIAVQYQRNDPEAFLFNVVDPETSLRQVAESALRQVVGRSTLDDVLTSGRSQIASNIREIMNITLKSYNIGLLVNDVNMQPAKAPKEVSAAFDDATKAREDRVRSINQANAHARDIEGKTRGQVTHLLEDAKAYQKEVELAARGSTERFELVLPQYQLAPKVTQTRLYLEALEEVFSNSSKVLIDNTAKADGQQNLIYIPLDRLVEQKQ
jgi:membrane protease subunit HflK